MDDFGGFDFGGDFGGGLDEGFGFDPWGDEFAFGDDQGAMGFGENQTLSPEEAQQIISEVVAEQEAMGLDSPLADALAGEPSDHGGDNAPTDVEPADIEPVDLSPNERVDDAFFDQEGAMRSVDTPYPGGTTQEALRGGYQESAAQQQMLQNLGAQRAAQQAGPPAPPSPMAGIPLPQPRPASAPQLSGPTAPNFADRFGGATMSREEMQQAAPTVSEQATTAADAMERSRSATRDTLAAPKPQTGQQRPAWTGRAAGSVAPKVRSAIEQAAAVAGATRVEVTSGARSGGGEPRHGGGNAADLRLYQGDRVLNSNNPADRQIMSTFIRESRARGMTGIGHHGSGYMGPEKIHVGAGRGADVSWGLGGRSAGAPDWVTKAFSQGQRSAPSPVPSFSAPPVQFAEALPSIGAPQPAPTIAGYAADQDYDMTPALRTDVAATDTALTPQERIDQGYAALPQDYPALAALSGSMPIPPPAELGTATTTASAQDAIQEALRGGPIGTGVPGLRGFAPEDAEVLDPSTLPEFTGTRITVRPQRGAETTLQEPGTGGETELDPIDVYPTMPGPGTPGTGVPSTTDETGPGTPGADPSTDPATAPRQPGESPEQAQQRQQQARRQQQRQRQQQRPPQGQGGRPRDPGEFNYPVTESPVQPQSVLRTDLRPEAQRVREDVQRVLQLSEPPERQLQRPPVLPGVEAGQMAGRAAAEVGKQIALTPEDIGNLLNETVLNRMLNQDIGGARTQEERMRGAFAIPSMAVGGGINAAFGPGRTALSRGINRIGAGLDVAMPLDLGDVVKGQQAAASMLPSGGVRGLNISPEELMSTFSSLNPVSTAQAQLSGSQTRNRTARNARIRELRQKGMTLNERDEVVPLPMEEIEAMNASGDVRRALDAGVPLHIIKSMGPLRDPGYNTSGAALLVGTAGLVSVPYIFRKFKDTVLPSLPRLGSHAIPLNVKSQTQAPPGVRDYSAPHDIVRATLDDANAAAINAIGRIGAPVAAVEAAQKIGWLQTRGQAVALTEAAVHLGEMNTVSGNFRVTASLNDLARRIGPRTKEYNQYQIALDTIDDINMGRAIGTPPKVRTTELSDALALVNYLEVRNPDFQKLNAIYKENLRKARQFAATGEDATMTRSEVKELTQTRPNEVPMTDRDRKGVEYVNQSNAVQTLADHVRNLLRDRMENTFNGELVRIARRQNSDIFSGPYDKDTYRQMIKDNPAWESHSINVPNRGRDQYYFGGRTITQAMKFDPYGFSSIWGSFWPALTRAFQAGTTGIFAPIFATTNMIVTWGQLKLTTPGFGNAPSILNTLAAVPRQAGPQLARYMAETLNHNSDHWFRKVFGDKMTDGLGKELSDIYMNSFYRLIQRQGGTTGTLMHNPVDEINQAKGQWALKFNTNLIPPEHRGWASTMKDGYMGLMESLHGAATFAAQVKQMKGTRGPLWDRVLPRPVAKHPMEAVLNARIAAADTRITGSKPLPYEGPGRSDAYPGAYTAEFMRANAPWTNAITQGQKRIADAWMTNPAEFTAKLWMYTVAPQAASYFWNMYLGKDPEGTSYNDYQMNMRSEDAKAMKMYLGIPGRPAREGLDFRFLPHEGIIGGRLALGAIHHVYGNPMFTGSEEFGSAAQSYIRNAFTPASPVWMNAAFAVAGYRNFGGPLSPELMKQRQDPYDPLGNMPGNIELGTRAFVGGLGEIIGAGAASMVYPEQTIYERLTNTMHSMARRAIEKDTVVSNVTGIRAPQNAITQVGTWVFDKNKEMGNITEHMNRATGVINVRPGSGPGREMIQSMLPQGISRNVSPMDKRGDIDIDIPGHPIIERRALEGGTNAQPTFPVMGTQVRPPNNPLFLEFANPLRQLTKTDAIGYRSAWREHAIATKQLATLRKIPHAGATLWQQELDPVVVTWLSKYNVDRTDPKAVQNFLIRQQHDSRLLIRGMILGMEADMTKRAQADPRLSQYMQSQGLKSITMKDLRPYVEDPEVPELPGFVPDVGQFDTP